MRDNRVCLTKLQVRAPESALEAVTYEVLVERRRVVKESSRIEKARGCRPQEV
jgi:hypothetical protein